MLERVRRSVFDSATDYRSRTLAIDTSARRARVGCLWMPLGCLQVGCLGSSLLVLVPLTAFGGWYYGWAATGTLLGGMTVSAAGIWVTRTRLARIALRRRSASLLQVRLLTALGLLFMVMPLGVMVLTALLERRR